MVLVDTSVWIDFFKGVESHSVQSLSLLLEEEADLFCTGIVLQEILAGIYSASHRKQVQELLSPLLWVAPLIETHIQAADIFRSCRKKGFQIRNSVDCLIAALVMEHDLTLLHQDRDYGFIQKIFPLKML